MKEVRLYPLPCSDVGEECVIEIPADGQIVRVGMVQKVSALVTDAGQRRFSAGPALRIVATIGVQTVPRRFVAVEPGQTVPDEATHVGSAAGRFPDGKPFDIDVFEIPPSEESANGIPYQE